MRCITTMRSTNLHDKAPKYTLCACKANVWLIAGILFLTVLTSVPPQRCQRLGVQLNKSILHDFSDFNSPCAYIVYYVIIYVMCM